MTPPTVNAYYNPQMNDINFPAGVLQPPLFDPKMDDAPNYGNTGGTIGHELTHGFDDEGRQFDAKGNLRDWWTQGGRARSSRSAPQCVVDQYAQYSMVDDIKINSKLTLGRGRRRPRRDDPRLRGLEGGDRGHGSSSRRDGLTPEQRFFVGFAQWACENERPENLRVQRGDRIRTRRRGTASTAWSSNMPEFAPGVLTARPASRWSRENRLQGLVRARRSRLSPRVVPSSRPARTAAVPVNFTPATWVPSGARRCQRTSAPRERSIEPSTP